MKVLTAYHAGDASSICDLLKWITELGPCKNHDVILLADAGVNWDTGLTVLKLAQSAFRSVTMISTARAFEEPWPLSSNQMFSVGAQHIQEKVKEPFLWLEPDAIPLKSGWLDSLDAAYTACGKPFMGAVTSATLAGKPFTYLNGCAVYPPNAYELLHFYLLKPNSAWDVASADKVVPLTANTNLICCLWGEPQKPPVFAEQLNPAQSHIKTLATLPKTAVLFHRCKDGSLTRLLRARYHGVTSSSTLPDTCIVQTGRYGDVINILPVAKKMADDKGKPVAMLTSSTYVSLLDGCSYIVPESFPERFEHVHQAIKVAKAKYPNVIVTQVYGEHWVPARETDSFCQESWRLAGLLKQWGKLPLIFDKRDKQREAALVSKHADTRPLMLVNLSGISSPPPFAVELMRQLIEKWHQTFRIVDLANVRCERIYDLLGLYDAAAILITSDTATFHLAAASSVPAIEFYADQPTAWHGSPQKSQVCLLRLPYSAVLEAVNLSMIHQAVRKVLPQISLTWNEWKPHDSETNRRIGLALQARLTFADSHYHWKCLAIKDDVLPRLFEDGKRRLPYVKDLIEAGLNDASSTDGIALVNCDVGFGDRFAKTAEDAVRSGVALAIRRNEFGRLNFPVPDYQIPKGRRHIGADAFVFTRDWWEKMRDEMPDMVIATEAWDLVLTKIILMHGGQLLYDLIWHEWHPSSWFKPENRVSLPSQQHNLKLAHEFCSKHGLTTADYGLPALP